MDARSHEWVAAGTVGGFGVLTLAIHGYYLLTHDLPLAGVVFGVAIPMATSVGLVAAGLWLYGAGFGELAPRVASWCLVGAVVLLAVGSTVTVFQLAVGEGVTAVRPTLAAQATVGGLLGTLLGVYDTQRLRTRAALESERETASRLGRRLTVLNRVLRHDVRNAVNVIRGNAEAIVDGADDPVAVAEIIRDQASEMVEMSERAREVEAALSEDLEPQRFDLGEAVGACAADLERRREPVTVHRSVETGAWVEASPLVETAVERLMENAVQHNDAPVPTVWVDVATGERDGGPVVSVRIADDGPGIPDEQIAVIEQGRETALEHTSGLGLWHVNWIIETAGGDLRFEERTPRGSVVEFSLPLAGR